MNHPNRFMTPVALALALALSAVTNGCGSEPPLSTPCCSEFKVGADLSTVDFGVDASIKGQFNAFAQASADLAAAAQGALDEVLGACKGIAQAGGANADKDDDARAKGAPADRVSFWCALAQARINAAFGGQAKGALKIDVAPAECKASFKAEANCQASCSVDGTCDVKANPPTCDGGKLEVSCAGECKAKATAATPSISCEGGCEGDCSGSCTAQGGAAVDCNGTCEGTCSAGGKAGGTGIQPDGTCMGKCDGTCTAGAAGSVSCAGICKGQCSGTCKARPGAASAEVKCDGECSGTAQPLSCKGGELKAECQVDANCAANCKASATAKAECTPPNVDIRVTGSVSADGAVVLEALRANLPSLLLVVQARGKAFGELVAKVSTSGAATFAGGGKLGAHGALCFVAIAPVVRQAADNAGAAVDASLKVSGSLGL